MTTDSYLADLAIPAALAVLPPALDTPNARAMLLAIAQQESRSRHRRQILGPARGFWQFEVGGVRGVLGHPRSKPLLVDALDVLSYPTTDDATSIYIALEHNDVLAAVCARLLLYTVPRPLPAADADQEGWDQYISAWRPGKPHKETWGAAFARGWALVG